MHKRRFQLLVSKAFRRIPSDLLARLDNVAIVVEKRPTPEQLAGRGMDADETLLGLYEGIPLTQRGVGYGMVVPDRIILFQEPIEEMCATDAEIRKQVQRTVIHEIAHHLGIGDEQLEKLGWS